MTILGGVGVSYERGAPVIDKSNSRRRIVEMSKRLGKPTPASRSNVVLFHTTFQLDGFRNSNPAQNCQLNVGTSKSSQ